MSNIKGFGILPGPLVLPDPGISQAFPQTARRTKSPGSRGTPEAKSSGGRKRERATLRSIAGSLQGAGSLGTTTMNRFAVALVAVLAADPALAQSGQEIMNGLARACYQHALSGRPFSQHQWKFCAELVPELKAAKARQDAEDRAKRQPVPVPRPRPVG